MDELIKFKKMHGCGNDFVIVDVRDSPQRISKLTATKIAQLSDRQTGIGCDQFIVISDTCAADVKMSIFNRDGSVSGACGNATRCIAKILFEEASAVTQPKTIETSRGLLICRKAGELIQVDMGPPLLLPEDIPVRVGLNPKSLNFDLLALGRIMGTAIGMGNPHCVFFTDDINKLDIEVIGSVVEHHEFFPHKTNVEFVQIVDRKHVLKRTWERGVGETLACGSGACAVAVAGVLRDLTDRQVSIELKGGILEIEWRESDGHVLMTGPAEHVFTGEFSL